MTTICNRKNDYSDTLLGTTRGLPDLPNLRSLREMPSAFHILTEGSAAASEATVVSGPNNVRFAFIAAKRAEMLSLRTSCDCYGEEGGWYWRPYYPEDESVGALAEAVAGRLRLRYHELPVAEDLLHRLKEAERNKEVVVLLVDAWSVRLDRYRNLMRQYDEALLANCAVVVPWNDHEKQTANESQQLSQALRYAFPRRINLRLPHHYWRTRSSRDLRTKLNTVLNGARMMLIGLGEAERKAKSVALTAEARQEGIAADVKPNLRGPGGGLD